MEEYKVDLKYIWDYLGIPFKCFINIHKYLIEVSLKEYNLFLEPGRRDKWIMQRGSLNIEEAPFLLDALIYV